MRHGRAGPLDEHLDRLGRGGVDRRHLLGGEDRDHSATAMASASAVGVGQREPPRPDAALGGQRAAPGRGGTTDGAPLSARATSISRHPQAPSPTPIAFSTASLAAKRAA